ncbi:hypothetical protein [Clostridium sp. HBUAS56017]|uniref:hypothetical protein n=1 Tax=Clostridium sp. HBUAS56017 TaxID=2571128 RepID=UPI001177A91C|nr:hypothetical protein [Clostridium sp. HBUAS56017]
MKNELKIEFSRCLNSKKFKYCFCILFSLSILSYAMLFKETFNRNSLELQKATDYSMIINSSDIRSVFLTFILIAPVLCVLMYSDTFIEQRENNMYTMFLLRISKRKYILAKAITIFVVTFVSIFFILGFNEILTWISIPNIGVSTKQPAYLAIQTNKAEFFLQNIYDKFPHLYNFIIIAITALFCSISSLIAFNLSMIFKINKIIMIIITFLIINGTEMLLPEDYEMQMYIQTWPSEFKNFLIVLSVWTLVTLVTLIIGINKEIV